jgi:hypothetical protein
VPEIESPDCLNFKTVTPGSFPPFTSQVPVRFSAWAWASDEIGSTMNTAHNIATIKRFFNVILLDESYWLGESRSVRKGLRAVKICRSSGKQLVAIAIEAATNI